MQLTQIEVYDKMVELILYYIAILTDLVLKGGATRYKIVKKMNTKIMAMTSMSLRCILIIFIQFPIDQNFYGAESLKYLNDRLGLIFSDSMEYHDQIQWKIQTIMRDIIGNKGKAILGIRWGDPNQRITCPTDATQSVINAAQQMIRAIVEYLHPEYMFQLFSQILVDIEEFFLDCFKKIDVENELTGKRLNNELEYFVETLKMTYDGLNIGMESFEAKVEQIIMTKCRK